MLDLQDVFDDDREPRALTAPDTSAGRVPSSPDELPEDWWHDWGERTAVRHHDGQQALEHAEAEAFTEVLLRMRAAGEIT